MSTVEIRVRPVVRHIVTRYTRSDDPKGEASLETLGEFDSESYAEQVAHALRYMAAIEPPAAPQRPQVGDRIIVNAPELTTEATVEAVHEWKDRRLLDVYFEPGTYFHGFGGGQVVDNGSGPYLLEPRSILKD